MENFLSENGHHTLYKKLSSSKLLPAECPYLELAGQKTNIMRTVP